jgi:DNA invertase Pin-like site-specific DNA recombinase
MMGKGKRAAIYLRVSTGEQTVDNQRRELEAAAASRGWSVVAVYATRVYPVRRDARGGHSSI